MNEFLTLICDVMEHMKIGGFTKLRELEPELKRQYDVLDQQSQWDCLGGVAEAIKQNRKFQMLLFSYLLSALRDKKAKKKEEIKEEEDTDFQQANKAPVLQHAQVENIKTTEDVL